MRSFTCYLRLLMRSSYWLLLSLQSSFSSHFLTMMVTLFWSSLSSFCSPSIFYYSLLVSYLCCFLSCSRRRLIFSYYFSWAVRFWLEHLRSYEILAVFVSFSLNFSESSSTFDLLYLRLWFRFRPSLVSLILSYSSLRSVSSLCN